MAFSSMFTFCVFSGRFIYILTCVSHSQCNKENT